MIPCNPQRGRTILMEILVDNLDLTTITQQLALVVSTYGLRIVAAILILIAGRIAAGVITGGVIRGMRRTSVDETLIGFLSRLVFVGVMAFTVIAMLSKLGLQTTSFVAVLGAAGLAIGLALQGALSNFAAGVLLLIFRPFRRGDFVEAGGANGKVQDINIFTTVLSTPDNKRVIVPNAQITGKTIVNYNVNETRRVDLVAGIGYGDDIRKARDVLERVVVGHELVLTDPAPVIEVSELADSSVNLIVRPWVKSEDYWRVYWDLTQAIKLEFDKEGISIPFPQRDVHLFEASKAGS
jgi:small conductance mechanosensitive channel